MSHVPVPILRNSAVRIKNGVTRVFAAAADASTAKILVQGRHLTLTPAIKEYAESKVNKVSICNCHGALGLLPWRPQPAVSHDS
jgi:hypothetical protein